MPDSTWIDHLHPLCRHPAVWLAVVGLFLVMLGSLLLIRRVAGVGLLSLMVLLGLALLAVAGVAWWCGWWGAFAWT